MVNLMTPETQARQTLDRLLRAYQDALDMLHEIHEQASVEALGDVGDKLRCFLVGPGNAKKRNEVKRQARALIAKAVA